MQIQKEILEKWKQLRSFGDGTKIAAANPGIAKMLVSKAFKKGECNDEVFKAMAEFYQEKEKQISQYL